MKKEKVSLRLSLGNRTDVEAEAVVVDERKVFGRDEILVEITKSGSFWISKDRIL